MGATSGPWPELHLEYCHLGTIGQLKDQLSGEECEQLLGQGLSALVYLHGIEPQIVHRDLKPENILIHRRDNEGIHVKLSDFGLSQETIDLKTLCGTSRYMAPEVHAERAKYKDSRTKDWRYTCTVDIWSLGVVVWECAFGLPSNGGRQTDFSWCCKVVEIVRRELNENSNFLKHVLATTMVIIEPEKRSSARECYDLLCNRTIRTMPSQTSDVNKEFELLDEGFPKYSIMLGSSVAEMIRMQQCSSRGSGWTSMPGSSQNRASGQTVGAPQASGRDPLEPIVEPASAGLQMEQRRRRDSEVTAIMPKALCEEDVEPASGGLQMEQQQQQQEQESTMTAFLRNALCEK